MTSFYFEDIFERYASEIDDLRSDSEGKDVLNKRVRDKHKEFSFLLSMIDTAPEMVAPAFHGAFGFSTGKLLHTAANSEPSRCRQAARKRKDRDIGAKEEEKGALRRPSGLHVTQTTYG